jgi:predicted nucleotidyltransferase
LCYNGCMEPKKPPNDPVLARFRAAVTEIYGDRVERVVLFGSRARGDARPDADYDIAVFLKDAGTFTDESARLAAVSTDILFDTGAVISATPFPVGAYRERTGFMHELRKDGLDL